MAEMIGHGIMLVPAPAVGEQQLICFPPAGTGAAFFHDWLDTSARGTDVSVVQLPGRGAHLLEPPVPSMQSAARAVAAAIDRTPAQNIVLFGHSMGAWLGYEVATALQRSDAREVTLAVSACPVPGQRMAALDGLQDLPDDQFLDAVADRFGEIPDIAAASPPVRRLMLRTMRYDLQLCDDYVPSESAGARRSFRIDTFAGIDDQAVQESDVTAWSTLSAAQGKHHRFPGGHMYIRDFFPAVRDLLDS